MEIYQFCFQIKEKIKPPNRIINPYNPLSCFLINSVFFQKIKHLIWIIQWLILWDGKHQ